MFTLAIYKPEVMCDIPRIRKDRPTMYQRAVK